MTNLTGKVKKIKFKKIIIINVAFTFLYGTIIGPMLAVILFAVLGGGIREMQMDFFESIYQAVKFGLIVGISFGFILAIILGISLMPYKSTIGFRDKDYFLSRMNTAISRINYEIDVYDDDLYIFKEKRGRYANILVEIENNRAIISGHFNQIRNLKKFLIK